MKFQNLKFQFCVFQSRVFDKNSQIHESEISNLHTYFKFMPLKTWANHLPKKQKIGKTATMIKHHFCFLDTKFAQIFKCMNLKNTNGQHFCSIIVVGAARLLCVAAIIAQ